MLKKVVLLFILFCIANGVKADSLDVFEKCWAKYSSIGKTEFINLSYTETKKRLYNGMLPWSHTTTKSVGDIHINTSEFYREDSVQRGKRLYKSKAVYTETDLLIQRYGSKKLSGVTKGDLSEYIFETLRYSPIQVLNYFHSRLTEIQVQHSGAETQYKLKIDETFVTIHISNSDYSLQKIVLLNSDVIYGDVSTTFRYLSVIKAKKLFVPEQIIIDKVNGQISDTIIIKSANVINKHPILLTKPVDFEWNDDKVIVPNVKVKKFNERIHLIDLTHTNAQSMLVEFDSFLVVVDAPKGSENGELIIGEVKKIFPDKPIKYFSFGHRCPWSLGGIRPFIHKEITILCNISEDKEYLNYLVNAPHTIKPDSLHIQPKNLKTVVVGDSMTISDGEYEMKVYLIGEKSRHTNDFVIYYFPKEKVVFEDHLAWIKKEGKIKKAGFKQKGLYNAIKDLNLEVTTIVQSWPTSRYKLKTIINFSDLEKSVNIK